MGFERLASKWKTKTRASKTDLSNKKKLFLSDLSKPMIGMSYGEWGKAARLSVVFVWLAYKTESIEWFKKGQSFSRSHDLAPCPPPPPPLPSVSSTGDTKEDWGRETSCLWEREEGGRRGAKSYRNRPRGTDLNHGTRFCVFSRKFIFAQIA